MIRFGFFYIKGKMVIYDLCLEDVGGHTMYVATLSESPAIAFKAVRPETAIERLREWLHHGTLQPTLEKVTWMPTQLPGRRVAAHPH